MSFLDQSKGEVKYYKAVLDLLRLRIHCHILCLFFLSFFFSSKETIVSLMHQLKCWPEAVLCLNTCTLWTAPE